MSTQRSEPVAAAQIAERVALVGLALGVGCMIQPWWRPGMRVGFFVTAACILAQIVSSHWPRRAP